MKVSATSLCLYGVVVLNHLMSLTAVGARQLPVLRVEEGNDGSTQYKYWAPFSRRSLLQGTGAPGQAAAPANSTPELAPPLTLRSVAQSPASAPAPPPSQTPAPSRANASTQAVAFVDGLNNCTGTDFLASSVNMTGTAQNCTVDRNSTVVIYVGFNNTAFQQACNTSKGTLGPVDGNTTLLLCSLPVPASPPPSSCSSGCIAGIAIGATVGLTILAVLAFFAWRHFSDGSRPDVLSSWATDTEPAAGAPVYCRHGATGVEGRVSAWESDETCRVTFADGTSKLVQRGCIAPRFNVGDEVIYIKEKGVAGVAATVEASHGVQWPPFYRIRLFSGHTDSLNTTAEHLQKTASKNMVA